MDIKLSRRIYSKLLAMIAFFYIFWTFKINENIFMYCVNFLKIKVFRTERKTDILNIQGTRFNKFLINSQVNT